MLENSSSVSLPMSLLATSLIAMQTFEEPVSQILRGMRGKWTYDVISATDCEGHAMANKIGIGLEGNVRGRVIALCVPTDSSSART